MEKNVFNFAPPVWLPYRDNQVIQMVRSMSKADMVKYVFENPAFKLEIVPDVQSQFVIDIFQRIQQSDLHNERLTVILPNPYAAVYQNVAELCNKYVVSCRNLHVFFLNEWADQSGRIAPIEYKASYGRIFRKYFLERLQTELRPRENQIHYFTDQNIMDYSNLIDETGGGGADICYTSVGWSGRLASIEPEGEFAKESLEEYLAQTSCIATNHMISIAEDSLCGLFANSGDLSAVPPKSATIGPRDIKHAHDHMEMQDRTSLGGLIAWQCMSSRLMLFGPITPSLPASILRLYKGICFISDMVAKEIRITPDIPDEVTFAM